MFIRIKFVSFCLRLSFNYIIYRLENLKFIFEIGVSNRNSKRKNDNLLDLSYFYSLTIKNLLSAARIF